MPKEEAGTEKAAKSGHSGKAKKKWSKARVHEKLNNAVMFDKSGYDKAVKEVPTWRLITVSLISDRMKVTASLAKSLIKDLCAKGLIRPIVHHSSVLIYTRA